MKRKLLMLITAALFVTPFCDSMSDKPNPMFPNTEEITIVSHTAANIEFSLQGISCGYVVVAVFTSAPVINEKNLISNPGDIRCGIRSGMAGYGTKPVIGNFRAYDESTGDFTGGITAPVASDWLAIWAYDADYNLIASSEPVQL